MTVAKANLREVELRRIVGSSSWFTGILGAVRDCDPPCRVTPEIFRRRVVEKRIVERWLKVRVIHDAAGPLSA